MARKSKSKARKPQAKPESLPLSRAPSIERVKAIEHVLDDVRRGHLGPKGAPFGFALRRRDGSFVVYEYPFQGTNSDDQNEHIICCGSATQMRAVAHHEGLRDDEYELISLWHPGEPIGYTVRKADGALFGVNTNEGEVANVDEIAVGESVVDAAKIAVGNELEGQWRIEPVYALGGKPSYSPLLDALRRDAELEAAKS